MFDEEPTFASSRPPTRVAKAKHLIVPEVVMPLPTMRKPMCPKLTEKIIKVTYQYVPGASAFVGPSSTNLPLAHGNVVEEDEQQREGSTRQEESASPIAMTTRTTEASPNKTPSFLARLRQSGGSDAGVREKSLDSEMGEIQVHAEDLSESNGKRLSRPNSSATRSDVFSLNGGSPVKSGQQQQPQESENELEQKRLSSSSIKSVDQRRRSSAASQKEGNELEQKHSSSSSSLKPLEQVRKTSTSSVTSVKSAEQKLGEEDDDKDDVEMNTSAVKAEDESKIDSPSPSPAIRRSSRKSFSNKDNENASPLHQSIINSENNNNKVAADSPSTPTMPREMSVQFTEDTKLSPAIRRSSHHSQKSNSEHKVEDIESHVIARTSSRASQRGANDSPAGDNLVEGVDRPQGLQLLRRYGSSNSSNNNSRGIGSPPRVKKEGILVENIVGKGIRLLVIAVFSFLLFVTLLLNGYVPITVHGYPATFDFKSTFWPGRALDMNSAVQCGPDALSCRPFSTQDTWTGIHCLGNLVRPVTRIPYVKGGADGFYTADSHVCFSAMHAGVIPERTGGCFEMRLAGPKNFYKGATQNGITSRDFGWFPRSMEFRAVTSSNCHDITWATDLVAIGGLFALAVIWRIDANWMNHVCAQWGFYYAGMVTFRKSGDFWAVINDLSSKQFTLIPMCFLLFHYFGRPGFCPDPRKFPIEAMLFFCSFFWIFIHMEEIGNFFATDFTFSAGGFGRITTGTIAVLVVLAIVVPPLTLLQVRVIYRSGLFPQYFGLIVVCAAYVLTLAFASEKTTLSFHLHHYFIGLLLCIGGRGQKKFSIIIQAIGLALFVEGLALWDTDPLFDEIRPPSVGYEVSDQGVGYTHIQQAPILTRAEVNMDDPLKPVIHVEWILPSDLVVNYTCDDNTTDLIPGIRRVTPEDMNLRSGTAGSMFRTLEASGDDNDDGGGTTQIDVRGKLGIIADNGGVLLPEDLGPLDIRTVDFPFYASRNGILFNSIYYEAGLNETIELEPGSGIMTKENPLIIVVAMVKGGVSYRLPFPFPYFENQTYHEPDATLCERMRGIYSKLRAVEFNVTLGDETWWYDR